MDSLAFNITMNIFRHFYSKKKDIILDCLRFFIFYSFIIYLDTCMIEKNMLFLIKINIKLWKFKFQI